MLTVISPAKRLDRAPAALPDGLAPTEPAFAADAARLARIARGLSSAELQALMGISAPLGDLNRARFAAFRRIPAPGATKPAALMFDGDTYAGLEAGTLSEDGLRWAQGHLRILSGLYGLLRPLDLIQPYRLEMGSRLANPKGASLYDYWGTRIARALNAAGREVGATVLVNCASQEYFAAVAPGALKLRVITPVFLEARDGDPRIVSFFAKKARGAMARFIADHHLTDPARLSDFDTGGYRLAPDLCTPDRPVFLRAQPAEAA
jgi:cytoplasmic iron level regulating protein YaaA (DUF328/UPF0246 family)